MYSFGLERLGDIQRAALHCPDVPPVEASVASHISSSLPGQCGVSDWFLGKTPVLDAEDLPEPPRKWLFIVKTQLPCVLLLPILGSGATSCLAFLSW